MWRNKEFGAKGFHEVLLMDKEYKTTLGYHSSCLIIPWIGNKRGGSVESVDVDPHA